MVYFPKLNKLYSYRAGKFLETSQLIHSLSIVFDALLYPSSLVDICWGFYN